MTKPSAIQVLLAKRVGLPATASKEEVCRAAFKKMATFGYDEDARYARQQGWDAQAGMFISPDGRARVSSPGAADGIGKYTLYRRPERGPASTHPWQESGRYATVEQAIAAA